MLAIQPLTDWTPELLPAQLEQLRSEEALQQAVDRAYDYLSYRPRSREEEATHL